jgi:hypothetical protein
MNTRDPGTVTEAHFHDDETADFSASEMARHAVFQPTAVSAISWHPTSSTPAPASLPPSPVSTNERQTTVSTLHLLDRPYTDTPDALDITPIASKRHSNVFPWLAGKFLPKIFT